MVWVALAAMLALGPIAGSPPPQSRSLPAYNPVTSAELNRIGGDIHKGRDERSLSRKQARELRRESGEIAMLEERYTTGGLIGAEAAELKARIEVLRALVRSKRLGTVK